MPARGPRARPSGQALRRGRVIDQYLNAAVQSVGGFLHHPLHFLGTGKVAGNAGNLLAGFLSQLPGRQVQRLDAPCGEHHAATAGGQFPSDGLPYAPTASGNQRCLTFQFQVHACPHAPTSIRSGLILQYPLPGGQCGFALQPRWVVGGFEGELPGGGCPATFTPVVQGQLHGLIHLVQPNGFNHIAKGAQLVGQFLLERQI